MPITLQPHDFTINALGGVLDSRNPAGVQPNRSPVIATIPDQTRAMGSTFSLASYFSDPDGDALTCTRTGGTAPAGVTVSTAGTVAVSMAVPAGSYTVSVSVDDGRGGSASRTFNLSVFLGAPTGLSATALSSSSIGLTWNAVSGATYKVYRNSVLIASPATPNYTDVGLAASTAYSYTVSAVIGASESAPSSSSSATTLAASSGGAGIIFSDGFESGGVLTTQNGVSWGALYDGSPAGGKVSVSTARAKSGSRSLEFFYKANTYQCEQRIYFAPGFRRDEIWLKYDLFLPTNYAHSDTEGGNNKFLVVQSSNGSSFYMNFSLYAGTVPGVLARANLHWYVNGIEQTPRGVANMFFDGTGGLNGGVDDRGRWHRLVARFRANNQQTGIAELWKNGSQIINQTGLTASSTPDNIHEGYFLGWANSRYAADTYFYIDDVEVSTQAITP